jgi:elongation factor G
VVDLIECCAYVYREETLGAEFERTDVPEELRESFEKWREQMLEVAAEYDEELLGRYLAGETLDPAAVRASLRAQTVAHHIAPVVCGSAFKNKGIQQLLDTVVDLLPSPLDIPSIEGHTPDGSPRPGRRTTRPRSPGSRSRS